jgi:hypothetical protein
MANAFDRTTDQYLLPGHGYSPYHHDYQAYFPSHHLYHVRRELVYPLSETL